MQQSWNESPREGCLYQDGFNICNYGDATIRETYLKYRDLLGSPISSFDSRCQLFRLGKLCYDPGKPPDWKVEWANIGLQDLVANGYSPLPGSEPHPAVRDFLTNQVELGVDTPRVFGRIISPPFCDRATGSCRQWTDKTLFIFPQDAVSGAHVARAPLGVGSAGQQLPLTSPTSGVTVAPPSHQSGAESSFAPLLVIAAILVIFTVVLVLSRLGRQPSGPSTT